MRSSVYGSVIFRMSVTLTDFFSICYRINLNRVNGGFCDGPAHAEACRAYCMCGEAGNNALDRRYALLRDVLYGAEERIGVSDFVASIFKREFPCLPVRVIGHGVGIFCGFHVVHASQEASLYSVTWAPSRNPKASACFWRLSSGRHRRMRRLDIVGAFYGNAALERELRSLALASDRIESLTQSVRLMCPRRWQILM